MNNDIKAYYTRTDEHTLTLEQRVELANDVEADFFVSIHSNSNPSATVGGTETLYDQLQNDWDGMVSRRFATILQEEVSKRFGLKDKGIEPRSYSVTILKRSMVPVALLECGYMTNKGDLAKLISQESQAEIAQGIYSAILRGYDEKIGIRD
jgi:N-acetylmuramoyl-L-alanine amidase